MSLAENGENWVGEEAASKMHFFTVRRSNKRKPTHAIEVVADAHADELYHVGVPASRKRANLSAHELGEVREGGVT